jgi:hypothetical protein
MKSFWILLLKFMIILIPGFFASDIETDHSEGIYDENTIARLSNVTKKKSLMNEISNNNNSNGKLNTAEELYYRPYNTGKLNTMTTIAEKNKFLSKQNNHVVEPNQDESDNLLTEKSHLRGIYEIVDGYSCMQTKITVEVEVPDDDKEKVTVWLTPKENAPKLSKSKTKIQSGQSFTFVIPIGTNINAYLLHAELDGYTCNLYEENVLQAENKLICERNCCICLEKGSKNVKLPCKHDFHPRCIKKWFNMQVHQAHEKRKVPKINCPLCKKEVEIMYNLSISISLVIGKNDDYNIYAFAELPVKIIQRDFFEEKYQQCIINSSQVKV